MVASAAAAIWHGLTRLDMRGTGTVTTLAAVADLAPTTVEPATAFGKTFGETRRVAIAAHVVPVLERARPEQGIAGSDIFLGIEVKPSLPSVFPFPAIPGERESLNATAADINQVLLQRSVSQCVRDRERFNVALLVFGRDAERVAIPGEASLLSRVEKLHVIEVAQNVFRSRRLHGMTVIGFQPLGILGRMTCSARWRSGEPGRFRLLDLSGGGGETPKIPNERGKTDQCDEDQRSKGGPSSPPCIIGSNPWLPKPSIYRVRP